MINNYFYIYGYEFIDLKVVLFDMDGVLFDFMFNYVELWYKIMKCFGFGFSWEEVYMYEGCIGVFMINIVSCWECGYDVIEEEIKVIY